MEGAVRMSSSRLHTLLLWVPILLMATTPTLGLDQSRGGAVNQPVVDRIVVGLENFELVALSEGRVVFDYAITTGADTGPTPTGRFRVTSRLKNPWYTPDDEPNVEPGAPDNPIGSRWIGIDKPSYGLHGTNNPAAIGERASEGCIRLRNHQIEKLYRHVEKGTRIIIKNRFDRDYSQLRTVQHKPEDEEEGI